MKISASDASTILSGEMLNAANTTAAPAHSSFKAGLKDIILKYALPNTAYNPPATWCRAALAGVAGVWAVACAEGKAGRCAKAGAALYGAAASYGAAGSMPLEMYIRIEGMDANTAYCNHAKNPYDVTVGRRHNQLLKCLIINNPHSGPADAGALYSKVALSASEKVFYARMQDETIRLYLYLLSCNCLRCTRTVLAHHVGESDLLYIMNSYIYGVANTASLTDVLAITYDYELYISSAGTLTALQKNILLMGFAVAKYGINFWA